MKMIICLVCEINNVSLVDFSNSDYTKDLNKRDLLLLMSS